MGVTLNYPYEYYKYYFEFKLIIHTAYKLKFNKLIIGKPMAYDAIRKAKSHLLQK